MRISIADCNSPAAHPVYITAFYCHIPETRSFCIPCDRLLRRHIDTAVVHMLVVHISINVVDDEIAQRNPASDTFISRSDGNSGSVHFIRCTVAFPDNILPAVCQLEILQRYIFCIIQQYRRRYISAPGMCRGIQLTSIILIPDSLPVCCDNRRMLLCLRPILICTDHNR